MGNAAKFTESGEIELAVGIEQHNGDRVKIHARVRDTGIGIPEEKLGTIFDVFQQADASTTRKYGGTGLGLPICRKIAQNMEGEVWAENNQDQGSTFHFTAWLKKADGEQTKRPTPPLLAGKKVLIVDDNANSLAIVSHLLKAAGMHTMELANGEDATQVLQEAGRRGDPFDLCAIDVQMPGLSGYEVARRIRDLSKEIPHIRLLALCPSPEREAKQCMASGFDGFLPKPVSRQKLIDLLETLLGTNKNSYEDTPQEATVTEHVCGEQTKPCSCILLAEDNPVNQRLAKMMLTKEGYQVDVANNGLEAVQKYTKTPDAFDLIFMDVQMPDMDGMKATKAIRNEGFHDIPIVAMTAHAMKGDRERCLEAGMDDYITKPIKKEPVFEMIEKWVHRKDA
jgi:CheY-like chemotaxis protein